MNDYYPHVPRDVVQTSAASTAPHETPVVYDDHAVSVQVAAFRAPPHHPDPIRQKSVQHRT